jgi:hypothetical protein
LSSEFNFTDNQWYNFICGFHAGLKLKDLTLPAIDLNRLLYPIGVGGYGTIGIAIPKLVYDGTSNTGIIPVFVHDVDIDYSGFSVNIQWDYNRLRFDGVTEGQFGSIGTSSSTADIRYTYSNGVFKARGIRNNTVIFKEPIILFYINVTILTAPTRSNPINLNLMSNSNTNLNYTTLLKWVDVGGLWYNYYITPIVNISGSIVSDETSEDNKETIGDESDVSVSGSPSGVYIGQAFTAPGNKGCVPIYCNSNIEDNFPYLGVHINFTVKDSFNIFRYIDIIGASGFTLSINRSVDDDGYYVYDVIAVRSEALIDSCTFCYVYYEINNSLLNNYIIPLHNNISELIG